MTEASLATLPKKDSPGATLYQEIRAENAHQGPAGFYEGDDSHPLSPTKYAWRSGNPRSTVGVTDWGRAQHIITRVAAACLQDNRPARFIAVAVKHGNAVGVAVGYDALKVAELMVTGNPRAVFGGVIITNFVITQEIAQVFKTAGTTGKSRVLAAVYAPVITPAAEGLLQRTKNSCYMGVNVSLGSLDSSMLDTTPVRVPVFGGAYVLQRRSTFILDFTAELEVHGTSLTENEELALSIGTAICDNTVSNTILLMQYDKDGNVWLIGMGAGQQDRVGAAELAVKSAIESGHNILGSIAVSDSFFPFPDGPQVLIDAGVTTIYATSGSDNDNLVIATCVKAGVNLVMLPDPQGRLFSDHTGG